MIKIDDRIIDMLRSIGLTKYEAIVYVTLLSLGEASALDIVRSSGIPHPRVYDILASLNRRGLIEYTGGKPKKYRAIDPEIALDVLKERINERIDRLKVELSKIRVSERVEEPSVWVLYDADSIIAKMREYIDNAKYEVLLAIPTNVFRRVVDSVKRCVGRGISPVVILYRDVSLDSDVLSGLRGVEVYERPVIGTVLCIVDCLYNVISSFNVFCSLDSYVENAGYGLFITDCELANILSFYYYYSLLRGAHIICLPDVEDYDSKYFISIWRATNVVKRILSSGRSVRVWIKGRWVKDGRPAEVEDYVKDVIVDSDRHIYSIILDSGLSIGGHRATLENIEGRLIRVKVL